MVFSFRAEQHLCTTHVAVCFLVSSCIPGIVNHNLPPWDGARIVANIAVLTLTRTTKSVAAGQAPVRLEWKNIPGAKIRYYHYYYLLITNWYYCCSP